MSDCPAPQRRVELREARKALFRLPRDEWLELAGHPTVYYELRDYREHPQGKEEGAKTARSDINFMFKAFETGQVRRIHSLSYCTCFLLLQYVVAISSIMNSKMRSISDILDVLCKQN